jgi:hypothetical protein
VRSERTLNKNRAGGEERKSGLAGAGTARGGNRIVLLNDMQSENVGKSSRIPVLRLMH